MARQRTTQRSSKGTTHYAQRDDGKFAAMQSYRRTHGRDVERRSKAESTRGGSRTRVTGGAKGV